MVDEMLAPTSIPSASKSARGNNNGVDRLSSLCDELLHHVMSFLPMPQVVRTSLLSPRWRNLWSSTPFIHIDYQDFNNEDRLDKFGDHLLLSRDGAVCLDEASIFVRTGGFSKSSVWIRQAIKHKVRILHISGSHQCPRISIYPSQHLKIIRLQSLLLLDMFFRQLNNDCPVLEHLELERCTLCDVGEISSMSLKVLDMIRCFHVEGLLICAGNLTHLSILDPICYGAIVTRDLSSLVTALVSLSSDELHSDTNTVFDGHRLLAGLSHAATLALHAPLPELAFERGLQTCPMFKNLTSLVLGDWCMAADFYPLLRVLQLSNKLKELNLKLKMEECSFCMDSESALFSSRGTSLATGNYPSLERIKICCREVDTRVDVLVQALLPIFIGDGKISIERY